MENLGYKEGWSKPRRISRAVSVTLQNEITPLARKPNAPRWAEINISAGGSLCIKRLFNGPFYLVFGEGTRQWPRI